MRHRPLPSIKGTERAIFLMVALIALLIQGLCLAWLWRQTAQRRPPQTKAVVAAPSAKDDEVLSIVEIVLAVESESRCQKA